MLAYDKSKMAYDQEPTVQRGVLREHFKKFRMSFAPGTEPQAFMRPEWTEDYRLAQDSYPNIDFGSGIGYDAQPQLVTSPSSGIPAYLTFFMDPNLLKVLTAKLEAAEIFGEEGKGDWTSTTALFPVVERTYQVSSYQDYNENGSAGINATFPERQTYLFQTMARYGNLEVERMGLARISFIQEQKEAAIFGLNNYQNLSYFKGVNGLQNYGILNDPNLQPAISPIPKAAGGVQWIVGTSINATANEIFQDIQSLVTQSVNQSSGQINTKSKFVLALSPRSEVALTATNTFNVNVAALLKINFPGLEVKTAIQYGAQTVQNPQGSALGEIVQLWCPTAMGQQSGFCAFNTKLRAGPVIPDSSSYKQKLMQGTMGFVLRQPWAMSSMVGV